MDKFMELLNGKKTTVAAVVLTLAAFLDQVVVGMWGVSAGWVVNTIPTLEWIGMMLGGVGLTHKAAKAMGSASAPTP